MTSDGGHQDSAGEAGTALDARVAAHDRLFEDEMAPVLRVPFVGLFWRALAADPALLRRAWQAVAPGLATHAAERAAVRLRSHALIVEAAGIASHKAFKGDLVRSEIDYDLRMRINNFNHVARYALPKHLLAVSMLTAALDGAHASPRDGEATAIPTGIAVGAVAVAPIEPATARGRAAELLPVIAAAHDWPRAEDYYCSLARLPDYLGAAWNALRPVVGDEEYESRARELVESAARAAAALPRAVHFPTTDEERRRLRPLLALFREHILPETLIDCAMITALTDGPDADPRSPFDLDLA